MQKVTDSRKTYFEKDIVEQKQKYKRNKGFDENSKNTNDSESNPGYLFLVDWQLSNNDVVEK
jgi:hypothetical protein